LNAAASSTPLCGVYLFKGKLVAPKDASGKVFFVINEGSQAETHFDIPDQKDFIKIAGHLNQFLQMKATLKAPVSKMHGELSGLTEIHLRAPDPLKDQGMVQLAPMKCQGK
jgi:hypothetical protein